MARQTLRVLLRRVIEPGVVPDSLGTVVDPEHLHVLWVARHSVYNGVVCLATPHTELELPTVLLSPAAQDHCKFVALFLLVPGNLSAYPYVSNYKA